MVEKCINDPVNRGAWFLNVEDRFDRCRSSR